MYGADRLTTPLLRVNEKGEFDKYGEFKPISWKRAFDEMEKHIRYALKKNGPEAVAVFASGQFQTQGTAWHQLGFYQTFGIDEPSGCYDDIELTDTIIAWGSNMAEMHPILWSRCTDRKLSDPNHVKVVSIQTYTNRTCDLADDTMDFVKKHIIFAAGPVNLGYGMRRKGEPSLTPVS